MKQVDSSYAANFGRTFPGLALARSILDSGKPHWFEHLLSLWRPSGHASGPDGLRLAIRNGYINFYRRGQSVARVTGRYGKLRAKVHVKYILGRESAALGQKYWVLEDDKVSGPEGDHIAYRGVASLREWIGLIDEKYVGTEKCLVDDLVTINSNIIDLEMGLPAWGARTTAPRMDLVAIENQQVIFWEAKTITDSRIRCRAEYQPNLKPEVLQQLSTYRMFLEQDRHVELVEAAYRRTAAMLVELRSLADRSGEIFTLGEEIMKASRSSKLTVAVSPALVVLDEPEDAGRSLKSWKSGGHEAKLAGRVPMLVQEFPGPLLYTAAL